VIEREDVLGAVLADYLPRDVPIEGLATIDARRNIDDGGMNIVSTPKPVSQSRRAKGIKIQQGKDHPATATTSSGLGRIDLINGIAPKADSISDSHVAMIEQ
jgi:hypothetical protein